GEEGGAAIHNPDEEPFMNNCEPVVVAPLRREWERAKAEIRTLEERRARARTPAEKSKLLAKARGLYGDFRTSLGRYRVLDPACGSGNFLACRFVRSRISTWRCWTMLWRWGL